MGRNVDFGLPGFYRHQLTKEYMYFFVVSGKVVSIFGKQFTLFANAGARCKINIQYLSVNHCFLSNLIFLENNTNFLKFGRLDRYATNGKV